MYADENLLKIMKLFQYFKKSLPSIKIICHYTSYKLHNIPYPLFMQGYSSF